MIDKETSEALESWAYTFVTIDSDTEKKINNLIQKNHSELTKEEIDYLNFHITQLNEDEDLKNKIKLIQ